MRRLIVILVPLLIVSLSVGCLNRADDNIPETTSAASTVLQISNVPSINQSEYTAFTCQLNLTRGSGLNGKEINWFIDNVNKDSSFTQWGYASLNLTAADTQGLSIGKHILKATFDGDSDYSASNATAVFQVRTAPTPTPTPSASPSPSAKPEPRSITLSQKAGSLSVAGTVSGKQKDESIFIFTKPQGNGTWTAQDPYAIIPKNDGSFTADLKLTQRGTYDVVAIITSSHVSAGDTFKTLPSSTAQSPTITVK